MCPFPITSPLSHVSFMFTSLLAWPTSTPSLPCPSTIPGQPSLSSLGIRSQIPVRLVARPSDRCRHRCGNMPWYSARRVRRVMAVRTLLSACHKSHWCNSRGDRSHESTEHVEHCVPRCVEPKYDERGVERPRTPVQTFGAQKSRSPRLRPWRAGVTLPIHLAPCLPLLFGCLQVAGSLGHRCHSSF